MVSRVIPEPPSEDGVPYRPPGEGAETVTSQVTQHLLRMEIGQSKLYPFSVISLTYLTCLAGRVAARHTGYFFRTKRDGAGSRVWRVQRQEASEKQVKSVLRERRKLTGDPRKREKLRKVRENVVGN